MTLTALVLTACHAERQPAVHVESAAPVVTPVSYGQIVFPTALASAARVLGAPVTVREDEKESDCRYVRAPVTPASVSFMVVHDSIVRIDIDGAGVRTSEGIGVGDSEARLLNAYAGHARVAQSHYGAPTDREITVESPGDSLHRLIFQTSGGRVVYFQAGRAPEVDYDEGCH